MYLLPAIDILDGKAVRLGQGDYERVTVYNDAPVEQAKIFEDAGATWLHMVDLDGAKSGNADNIRVVGINPGPVGTDRHVTLLKTRAKHQFGDESRYKEFQKSLPLGRPAHAREIGDLMAFLASYRSGYTSGVIYTVDGGISAGWG